ncbi:hypothetical protein ACFSTE_07545 [Aquimarina hainanensis]|uniref:Lipoprotein n=2 Tax=Aquimarina hainanensis TaxID=1578017 RepID=A0ABW5N6Z9_9FLAO
MKKLLLPMRLYSLAALMLISLGACNQDTSGNDAVIKKYKEKIEAQQQEIARLKEALGENRKEPPSNIISLEQAEKMYHLYSPRSKKISKEVANRLDKPDFKATRSLYYKLDDLYHYLGYIRRQSKKANITPSGVRFYFGIYSDDYKRHKKDDYAGRQSLFFTPTVEKKITVNGEEEIAHLGYTLDDNFKMVLLKDAIGTDNRTGAIHTSHSNKQAASFFKLRTLSRNSNSLIGNELNGSPPRGNSN